MENNCELQNYQYIMENFLKQGYSMEEIDNFISTNKDYFGNISMMGDNDSGLYFICNHKKVYAALVVHGDSYWWSLYHNNKFQPLQGIVDDDLSSEVEHTDFIVEMMLNVAKSQKMKRVVPNIESMDVANKVKMLQKVGLNSNGYHVR